MTRDDLIDAIGLAELPGVFAEVEREIQNILSASGKFKPIVTSRAAKGKRLRPMVTLLSAMASERRLDGRLVSAAAAVEIIHQASLLHDKVMDTRPSREHADLLLAGDHMIAAGLAAAPDYDAVQLLSRCIGAMAEGQALQLSSAYKPEPDNKTYLKTISLKTASLFAAAGQLGAGSGTGAEIIDKFCQSFGRSFQLIDDVIDGEFPPKLTDKAVQAATLHCQEAIRHLEPLPDSPARQGLRRLAQYYLESSLSAAS